MKTAAFSITHFCRLEYQMMQEKMSIRFMSAFVILTIGLVNLNFVSAQGNDNLEKLDGSTVSGKLLSMTADYVEMEVKRSPTKIPSKEISYIRFFDEARRTKQARDYIDGRQFDLAARELSSMNEEWAKARPEAALEGLYLLAKAKSELALAGVEGHTLTDAVNVVREFREKGTSHYRFNSAGLLFAQLGKAAGRVDLAEKEYEVLKDVADSRISLEANLELGFIQLAKKDYAAAETSFQRGAAMDVSDAQSSKKKIVAQINTEVAKAGQGNADAAIAEIQKIIDAQSPDDVFVNGYGYNALGNVYMMNDKLKEAEVAFLHTELLFPANADADAEALYNLVQIWGKLGKSDRVTEGRDKLMTQYGGTYWTNRLNAR